MKLVNKQEKNPAVVQFKQTATPIGGVALDTTFLVKKWSYTPKKCRLCLVVLEHAQLLLCHWYALGESCMVLWFSFQVLQGQEPIQELVVQRCSQSCAISCFPIVSCH
jgi:hypothetical protein